MFPRRLLHDRTRQAVDACFGNPATKDNADRLANVLIGMQSQFPTTLEEDEAMLAELSSSLSEGARLAMLYQ